MSDRDLTLREAMEILSDLTPEEARAEVEAWLGEGWRTNIVTLFGVYNVEAVMRSNMLVRVEGEASTYRAAVDALKQAWRDAVRPVAERGVVFGLADLHHSADPAVVRQEYAKRIPFLTSLSLGEEA